MKTPNLLYRALLRVFPAEFRTVRGDDYVLFLQHQRAEKRYQVALLGHLAFLRVVIADALSTGLRMRMSSAPETADVRDPAARRSSLGSGAGPIPPTGSRRRGRFSRAVDALQQDVRFGVRTLAAAPMFTSVAVITLALGIGANTAIFTVVDSVLLRPLPYEAPDELVRVNRIEARSSVADASWPDFRDWREQAASFAGLAAGTEFSTDVQWDGETQQVRGAVVTHDMFSVLRVDPLHGRTFTPEEDVQGGPQVVILGYRLFAERFAADTDAVGRSITMNGEAHTIVGVMPSGFAYPYPEVDFWLPLRGDSLLVSIGLPANSRTLGFLEVIGRLAPGVSLAQARVEVGAVVRRIDESEQAEVADEIGIVLVPLHEVTVGGVRAVLLLVLGAVGVVLAIACANVANLSLSRASSRRREITIRSALGAPRARLVQQLMIESLLVALGGGLLGLLMAFGLTRIMLTLVPAWLPRAEEIGMSVWVFMFTAAAVMTSGLVSGLLPAWRASNRRFGSGLGEGARGASVGRGTLRIHNLLVVTQVALAVVLVAGAALFSNSFLRLANVDPGFDPTGLMRASITPSGRIDGIDALLVFYDDVLASVRALPGVEAASLTYSPPFAQNNFHQTIVTDGGDEDPDDRNWVGTVIVGDAYFDTIGIEIRRGRPFDTTDRRGGAPVVIVNETMAERFWPGEDAVGKRFRIGGGIQGSADSFDAEFFSKDPFTVVGVVADVRRRQLSEPPMAEFYRPHSQMAWGTMYLVVRAAVGTVDLSQVVQQTLWDIDSGVSVDRVGSVSAWMSDNVAEPRFRTLLMGAFSLLATVLAMVGVYAVMAWGVARRTREIGVRIALGAPTSSVLRDVMRRGLRVTAIGVALGLVAAVGATRLIAAMLYEVSPTDPGTLGAVVALVAGIALLACYVPARRASRVDPIVALRAQ